MSILKSKVKKHNIVALLEASGEDVDFRDSTAWLRSKPFAYAITHKVKVYELQVQEFWLKAETLRDGNKYIIKSEVQGKKFAFDEDDVSRILHLKEDEGKVVNDIDKEHLLEVFVSRIGYEGKESFIKGDKKEFVKSWVSKEWRYIMTIFISCLSDRKGGFDGMGEDWANYMIHSCNGNRGDLHKLIFRLMKNNADSVKKWLLYHRFVQMIINDKLKDLQIEGGLMNVFEMKKRVFADCRGCNKKFSGKITYLFESMYFEDRYQNDIIHMIADEEERAAKGEVSANITHVRKEYFRQSKKSKGKRKITEEDEEEEEEEEYEIDISKLSKNKNVKGVRIEEENIDAAASTRPAKRPTQENVMPDPEVMNYFRESLGNEISMLKTRIVNLEAKIERRDERNDRLERFRKKQFKLNEKLMKGLQAVQKPDPEVMNYFRESLGNEISMLKTRIVNLEAKIERRDERNDRLERFGKKQFKLNEKLMKGLQAVQKHCGLEVTVTDEDITESAAKHINFFSEL